MMKNSVLTFVLPILLTACGMAEQGSLTEDLQAQLAPTTGLQLTGVQFYEEGTARIACGIATWENHWGERQPERYFFARYAFPTKRWLADFDVYENVDKPCREHFADVAAVKQSNREQMEAGQRRIDERSRLRQEASERFAEELAKKRALEANMEAEEAAARETQQAGADQARSASDREAYRRAEEYEAEQQRRMREAVEEEQSR